MIHAGRQHTAGVPDTDGVKKDCGCSGHRVTFSDGGTRKEVYTLKDGRQRRQRWLCRIVATPEGGRPHRHSFRAATEREAKAKREVYKERVNADALNAARDAEREKAERSKVGAFLDAWLAEEQLEATTLDSYAGVINRHLRPRLGDVLLEHLTPDHVEGMIADLRAQKASAHSVRYTITVLHRALNLAVRKRLIAVNPAAGLKPKRTASKKFTPLTVEECERFLEAAKSERLNALFVLAVTTGLRRGEVLGLQWRDVDFANRKLTIRRQARVVQGKIEVVERTKSGRDRQIDLSKRAFDALQEHRESMRAEVAALRTRRVMREDQADPKYWQRIADKIESSPQVFLSKKGDVIDPSLFVRRTFLPLLKRAKCPRIRFHDLRHTTATLMLSKNVHPVVVQRLLGHSSISLTVDVYSGWVANLQASAVAAMDELFA